MNSLSITNLKQSKELVESGLASYTADYYVEVIMKREKGVVCLEEKLDLIDYTKKAPSEGNFSSVWSLGRLIDMLPSDIILDCDINNTKQSGVNAVKYLLNMGKDWVMYVALDGRRRYLTQGDNLLDAVVKMIITLLKDDIEVDDPII